MLINIFLIFILFYYKPLYYTYINVFLFIPILIFLIKIYNKNNVLIFYFNIIYTIYPLNIIFNYIDILNNIIFNKISILFINFLLNKISKNDITNINKLFTNKKKIKKINNKDILNFIKNDILE